MTEFNPNLSSILRTPLHKLRAWKLAKSTNEMMPTIENKRNQYLYNKHRCLRKDKREIKGMVLTPKLNKDSS